LYIEYQPIQVLSFPTPPVYNLPWVWPVFYNTAAFGLGLYSNVRENMWFLTFWAWLTSLRWCSPVPSTYLRWQNFIHFVAE
jgi:hypothetical protein